MAGAETAWTRFAPAPTGFLHLGHVANAIFVWGLAATLGAKVLLRIEDHDRERSRAAYEMALLEDLDWLGFVAGRRSGPPARRSGARTRRRPTGCAPRGSCTPAPVPARRSPPGPRPVARRGAARAVPGRVGPGRSRGRRGTRSGWPSGRARRPGSTGSAARNARPSRPAGDLAIRDRQGNWTYALCVVVDDLRQSISLVIRGEDLAEATPPQIRLGRLLGRSRPPTFAHHPLIRKADGAKLSKADGDTGVGELRAAGRGPADVIGEAAAAVGLLAEPRPVAARDVGQLFAGRSG